MSTPVYLRLPVRGKQAGETGFRENSSLVNCNVLVLSVTIMLCFTVM